MSKVKKTAEVEGQETVELPRRLCSEIQLFDLCELERCHFRDERFCTDPEMLARFEAEAEPEDRPKFQLHNGAADDEEDEQYPEERDEDDDEYSVFDDEDRMEQDEEW